MWQVPPRRILVAADFGDESATAVWIGGSLAGELEAGLTVLHAETLEAPLYFTRDQLDQLERDRVVARSAAATFTREFVARHTSVPADIAIVDGPPAEAILKGQIDADLIVLGTHGYRGARRWWLGSVAERVVAEAVTPVVVVHAIERQRAAWAPGTVLALGAPAATPAARWIEMLRGRFGVSIDAVDSVQACPKDAPARASLVVVPVPARGSARPLMPALVELLTGCPVPVLFVPESNRAQL